MKFRCLVIVQSNSNVKKKRTIRVQLLIKNQGKELNCTYPYNVAASYIELMKHEFHANERFSGKKGTITKLDCEFCSFSTSAYICTDFVGHHYFQLFLFQL